MVKGLGFRVYDLYFRVWRLGLGFSGQSSVLELMVKGLRLGTVAYGSGCRVYRFRVTDLRILRVRVQGK